MQVELLVLSHQVTLALFCGLLFVNGQSEALQARIFIRGCRTNMHFTSIRHSQWVDFPVRVSTEYAPQFLCSMPTTTLIRGPISTWAWEAQPWGTRLMIPTELTWRAYILGAILRKFRWAVLRIAGAAGVGAYRDPANWFMVYTLKPDILLELRGEIMPTIFQRKEGLWTLHARS
jgi:hypothetical protein